MAEYKKTTNSEKSRLSGGLRRFFARRKKLIVVLLVAAVAVGILWSILGNFRGAAANASTAPQTFVLARMDLNLIVSGIGTLQSSMTHEVTSSLSYNVAETFVKEGDRVTSGQLLALLDTEALKDDIAGAKKNIADSEAQDALALAQAQRKLQDATNQYAIDEERLNNEVDKAYSRAAKAADEMNAAKKEMDSKKLLLDKAREELENYPAPGEPGHDEAEYSALNLAVETALKNYTDAAAAYEALKTAASQAQTAYDSAVQQRDASLRQDRIAVENARDAVNTQKLRDSAASYRTQLKVYNDNLEKCRITAPVSGTVTSMNAKEGKSAGGVSAGSSGMTAALFTIEDTDRLEISSGIPEYDAVNVKVGMPVNVASDAVEGEVFSGTVKSISPKATDANSNFTVIIELVSPSGRLAIGMSVKFNIVTESKKDVFAVPYDAVTKDTNGQDVVYVYSGQMNDSDSNSPAASNRPGGLDPQSSAPAGSADGANQAGWPLVVVTGMETDYYIEISGDGLAEGLVLLADPEGRNVSSDSGGLSGSFAMGGRF
ncbi:MAG: efflux RND transporter periplasmic adaptor subunit [Oscillospiraceae bacterium]|nr:efflux RND transporter periplasmic adaptor subunit [Oscillospiraceae bacterium]